jgi:hypothetical protein
MRIEDYQIVSGLTKNKLEELVRQQIKDGWEPIGGVAIAAEVGDFCEFWQAMIKYEK